MNKILPIEFTPTNCYKLTQHRYAKTCEHQISRRVRLGQRIELYVNGVTCVHDTIVIYPASLKNFNTM